MYGHKFSTYLCKYLVARSYVDYVAKLSFKVAYHFYSPSNEQEFLFFTSSSAFGVVRVLYFSHSNKCIVVSHICFNVHFSNDMWCSASFYRLICRYIFFGQLFTSLPLFKLGNSFSYCRLKNIFRYQFKAKSFLNHVLISSTDLSFEILLKFYT